MMFGALQGLILCVIILKKNHSKKTAKYLAIMLFGLSMNLLYYFSYDIGVVKVMPILESLYFPWAMLSAACFYFYIVFTAPFQKELTRNNYFAFAPFVIFTILHISIRVLMHYNKNVINIDVVNFIFNFEEYFGILFTLYMGFISYKKLGEIETLIEKQYSNYNISKLIFHKRLLVVVLVFCLLWVAVYTYAISINIHSMNIYYFLWLFIAFVLQWISWTGFIRDEALLPVFKSNKNQDATITVERDLEEDSVRDKSLKIQKDNPIYIKLIKLFEEEHIYKRPELSLTILSETLNISKSYLSAIINQTTDKNFYEFVNKYRVDYLISLFEENKTENYTILSLAFDAGFNSKSTFQAAFKKITTQTPTQYIKQLKIAI